jgi:hypothetical protein
MGTVRRANKRWISAKLSGELLEMHPSRLPKVAALGNIRTRRLPGACYVEYYRPEVERVAAEAIMPAAPQRARKQAGRS